MRHPVAKLLLVLGLLLGLSAPAATAHTPAGVSVRQEATAIAPARPMMVQLATSSTTYRWAKKSHVKTRYDASGKAKYRRTVRIGYRFAIDTAHSTKGWWKVTNRNEWVYKGDVTSNPKTLWSSREYARMQAWRMINAHKGWNVRTQYPCYKNLINHESSWDRHAHNGSGAYGLPQALPGRKMASAGKDWRDNPNTQLEWGLNKYVKPRYGSPCSAWSHWKRLGWY